MSIVKEKLIGLELFYYENYKEKEFNPKITEQLIIICKSLKAWIPKKINGKEVDYYQYLIFKIKHGNLIEIMP